MADWPIHTPRDLARYTLLRHVTVPEAWLRWSETHGVEGLIDPSAGPEGRTVASAPLNAIVCND